MLHILSVNGMVINMSRYPGPIPGCIWFNIQLDLKAGTAQIQTPFVFIPSPIPTKHGNKRMGGLTD
jgi:hypothetical protein